MNLHPHQTIYSASVEIAHFMTRPVQNLITALFHILIQLFPSVTVHCTRSMIYNPLYMGRDFVILRMKTVDDVISTEM